MLSPHLPQLRVTRGDRQAGGLLAVRVAHGVSQTRRGPGAPRTLPCPRVRRAHQAAAPHKADGTRWGSASSSQAATGPAWPLSRRPRKPHLPHLPLEKVTKGAYAHPVPRLLWEPLRRGSPGCECSRLPAPGVHHTPQCTLKAPHPVGQGTLPSVTSALPGACCQMQKPTESLFQDGEVTPTTNTAPLQAPARIPRAWGCRPNAQPLLKWSC